MANAREYLEWLERTKDLSPTAIKSYYYVVRKFLSENEPTIENMTAYLTKHARKYYNGRTIYSALKHYCVFLKHTDWGEQLNLPKPKGRKYVTSKVTYEEIRELLNKFTGVCRDVAMFQFLTGCRQVEAWFFDFKNMEIRDDRAEALIFKKGGATHLVSLPIDFAKYLTKKYAGKSRPFLDDDSQTISRDDFLRDHYSAYRTKYHRAWTKVSEDYTSHDVRRAVLRAVIKKHGLPMAKKIAGHAYVSVTMLYDDESAYDTFAALKGLRDGSSR